ncbi:hypothetical protein Tco_0223228 [Tanacetum coccineum]
MHFHELEELNELLEEGMLVSLSNHLLMVMWMSFGNGSSSGCHGGLWWLIEDEEDGEVDFPKSVQAFWVRIAEASRFDVRIEDHHFVQKWECRMVGNREVRESLVTGFSTITSGSTSLSQSKWTHDSFNDIVDAIVKMRVKFHDMSKESSQENPIGRWDLGVARALSILLTKK